MITVAKIKTKGTCFAANHVEMTWACMDLCFYIWTRHLQLIIHCKAGKAILRMALRSHSDRSFNHSVWTMQHPKKCQYYPTCELLSYVWIIPYKLEQSLTFITSRCKHQGFLHWSLHKPVPDIGHKWHSCKYFTGILFKPGQIHGWDGQWWRRIHTMAVQMWAGSYCNNSDNAFVKWK